MTLQLQDLLANGYFPKELPPPFKTDDYAKLLAPGDPAGIFSTKNFSKDLNFSMLCTHSLVRTGGLRRLLGIPNPKHYFHLANHVVTNWTSLKNSADQSPYSLSKPIVAKLARAISPEHGLNERVAHRAELRARARFSLIADVSHFFPSIYTHSIPWAIMGKTIAKQAHQSGTLKRTPEDLLDTYSRLIINNQTVGIPIGPDTSRLLAEVILSRIDTEIASDISDIKGIRYIDDYEFASPTRSELEKVLSSLQHYLSQYELTLNPNKTKIVELPDQLENPCISNIRVFVFRFGKGTGQKNDLTAYFDMVFNYFKQFPQEGLLKYAVARLQSEIIDIDNWAFFQNILAQCILVEPACIPQVCDQIISYTSISNDYKIEKQLWEECLNRIVYERVLLGYSSEAAWAMWLMKILDIPLSTISAKAVGNCEDSVTALMGLGLITSGLANQADLSNLDRFNPASGLYENQWLLCYQGNLMSWFKSGGGRGNLKSDPVFLHLESNNVSFFDINISPPQPFRYSNGSGGGCGGGGY